MMRSPLLAAVAAALVLLVACDTDGGITVYPEVEQTWGFEDGLSGWTAASANAGATWTVDVTGAASASGSRSLMIDLPGAGPSARVWVQRAFEVDTTRTYTVTVEFDLASTEAVDATSWNVLAGASANAPTGADLAARGPTEGGSGSEPTWVHRRYTFQAISGADGALWIGVGIGSTSAESRTYYLDDVRVELVREN